jgi:hypothetical protein
VRRPGSPLRPVAVDARILFILILLVIPGSQIIVYPIL